MSGDVEFLGVGIGDDLSAYTGSDSCSFEVVATAMQGVCVIFRLGSTIRVRQSAKFELNAERKGRSSNNLC